MSEQNPNSLSLRGLAVILAVMAGAFWILSQAFSEFGPHAMTHIVFSTNVLAIAISVAMSDRSWAMLLTALAVVLLTTVALGAVVTYLALIEHQAMFATWLVLYVAQTPVHFVFATVYFWRRCRRLAQVHLVLALFVLGYNLAAGNPLIRWYDALLPPLLRAGQEQRN
jgi:hypothetical protein